MLKKIGRWNNIPEELLPKLPKPGTIEIFRFTDTYYDAVANEGQPVTSYETDITIPYFSKVRIKDTWYEIGMVSGMDKDQNPLVSSEYRQRCQYSPSRNGGQLRITIGRSALDDAFYQYLKLASFVGNNEGRDESEVVIMEYVDIEKIAQTDIEKQDLEWKAIGIAANLSEDSMAEMAHILNLPKNLTPNQIVSQVRNAAKTDPAGFLAKVGDENASFKARIAHALQLEVVSLNPETSSIHWNDSSKGLVLKVDDITKSDSIQSQYAEFAKTDAGKKVDQVLTNAIKKASKKAV